jgi:RNA polymerase sigma-70 factor (ECF subfamily)
MKFKPGPEGHDDSTTLGDLLYRDQGDAGAAEGDWVRLVQSIAAGDQQALRTLYERTHRLVFSLAARICHSSELAEEVTLDVFHDVWRRSVEYDSSDRSVVGWIMIQARSRAIERLRFEQRRKRSPDPQLTYDHQPVQVGAPPDVIEARQRRCLLQAALTALTPDERKTIETAFFSELTYPETAARLDQPLGTVKTRVRSALAKLREALGSEEDES